MAAPTLLDYAESVWSDTSATVDTTDDLDWAAATDVIVVLAATEDNGLAMATPTGTGITLSALAGLPTNTVSSCKGYGWSGAVSGNGNSVLTSTNGASGARGIAAWAFSGSDGLGTPVVSIDTALTHNVTVAQADSTVVMVLADWNATTDVTVTTVPAGGTIREAILAVGTATFLVIEWPTQATGTRAYGVSAWTGTGTITKITVEAKGAAGGTQTVSPSGIASGEAFGTPTLTPGVVTVSPAGIVSAEVVGTPTITAGAVTVSPSGIPSSEAFGTPTLTPGAVTVSPGGIATGEALGTPALTAGAVTVSPSGIGSGEAFGTPTIAPGAVTIGSVGIASGEAFGTPTLTGAGTVAPVGIPSGEAFGTPTVTAGAVVVTPTGIPSGEATGTPTLGASVTVSPSGIASAEAVGTPTLMAGATTIGPAGIPSGEAFGVATLTGGAVVDNTISPVGIPSGEAFGAPVIGVFALAGCRCFDDPAALAGIVTCVCAEGGAVEVSITVTVVP